MLQSCLIRNYPHGREAFVRVRGLQGFRVAFSQASIPGFSGSPSRRQCAPKTMPRNCPKNITKILGWKMDTDFGTSLVRLLVYLCPSLVRLLAVFGPFWSVIVHLWSVFGPYLVLFGPSLVRLWSVMFRVWSVFSLVAFLFIFGLGPCLVRLWSVIFPVWSVMFPVWSVMFPVWSVIFLFGPSFFLFGPSCFLFGPSFSCLVRVWSVIFSVWSGFGPSLFVFFFSVWSGLGGPIFLCLVRLWSVSVRSVFGPCLCQGPRGPSSLGPRGAPGPKAIPWGWCYGIPGGRRCYGNPGGGRCYGNPGGGRCYGNPGGGMSSGLLESCKFSWDTFPQTPPGRPQASCKFSWDTWPPGGPPWPPGRPRRVANFRGILSHRPPHRPPHSILTVSQRNRTKNAVRSYHGAVAEAQYKAF